MQLWMFSCVFGVKIWMKEWHGAEIQMQDYGMICSVVDCSKGQGTPTHKAHLILHRDVREPVRAKTKGVDLYF